MLVLQCSVLSWYCISNAICRIFFLKVTGFIVLITSFALSHVVDGQYSVWSLTDHRHPYLKGVNTAQLLNKVFCSLYLAVMGSTFSAELYLAVLLELFPIVHHFCSWYLLTIPGQCADVLTCNEWLLNKCTWLCTLVVESRILHNICLIDRISDSRSQGCTDMQSLDYRDTLCSQARFC